MVERVVVMPDLLGENDVLVLGTLVIRGLVSQNKEYAIIARNKVIERMSVQF